MENARRVQRPVPPLAEALAASPAPLNIGPDAAAASPALALQQRLSEAALRGFYTPTVTPRRQRYAAIAAMTAIALGCWALVFGFGVLLVR